jgi:hypothetical protein
MKWLELLIIGLFCAALFVFLRRRGAQEPWQLVAAPVIKLRHEIQIGRQIFAWHEISVPVMQ